jgi:endogenous inhibitor of DNA gyrase (YacG/DUF329 family)
MSDAPTASTDSREELRRRWLAHAAGAFDLMFHPDHQVDLVTFDQREARACELGRDLTTWLIEQHTNADEMAHPTADRQVPCPKCGRPARRKIEPGAPQGRCLTGLSGEVQLQRDQFACTACRIVFFPPGP